MPKYELTETLFTYATVTVEAASPEGALAIYHDDTENLEWSYETDFHYSHDVSVDALLE